MDFSIFGVGEYATDALKIDSHKPDKDFNLTDYYNSKSVVFIDVCYIIGSALKDATTASQELLKGTYLRGSHPI